MNLNIEARNILEKYKYKTYSFKEEPLSFVFEDQSLLGFVCVCVSVKHILDTWKQVQDSFLSNLATQLSRDPTKAWNTYSVFLTEGKAIKEDHSHLTTIEEDLRGTRKIVGYGILTRTDLENVLMPLLPIRHKVFLATQDYIERLKTRIEIPELFTKLNEKEIYDILERRNED
jgi:hypothetical protein